MAFTSWAALRTAILDDLASGKAMTKSYTIDGRTHLLRSIGEIREFIKLCNEMIVEEQGGMTNYASFK